MMQWFQLKKRLLIGLTLAVLFACVMLSAAKGRKPDTQSDILRLHILANSDSAADQQVKLAVRDALIDFLPACNSAREAKQYLMTHGAEVLYAAERTLSKNGFSYGAQLMLGQSTFPARTYGDTIYPAGEYEALRVVLGRGAGQNWWCVLFPPLCIITAEAEPLPENDELTFESSLLRLLRGADEEDAS